jgi:Plasma-membrane choline transporter
LIPDLPSNSPKYLVPMPQICNAFFSFAYLLFAFTIYGLVWYASADHIVEENVALAIKLRLLSSSLLGFFASVVYIYFNRNNSIEWAFKFLLLAFMVIFLMLVIITLVEGAYLYSTLYLIPLITFLLYSRHHVMKRLHTLQDLFIFMRQIMDSSDYLKGAFFATALTTFLYTTLWLYSFTHAYSSSFSVSNFFLLTSLLLAELWVSNIFKGSLLYVVSAVTAKYVELNQQEGPPISFGDDELSVDIRIDGSASNSALSQGHPVEEEASLMPSSSSDVGSPASPSATSEPTPVPQQAYSLTAQERKKVLEMIAIKAFFYTVWSGSGSIVTGAFFRIFFPFSWSLLRVLMFLEKRAPPVFSRVLSLLQTLVISYLKIGNSYAYVVLALESTIPAPAPSSSRSSQASHDWFSASSLAWTLISEKDMDVALNEDVSEVLFGLIKYSIAGFVCLLFGGSESSLISIACFLLGYTASSLITSTLEVIVQTLYVIDSARPTLLFKFNPILSHRFKRLKELKQLHVRARNTGVANVDIADS